MFKISKDVLEEANKYVETQEIKYKKVKTPTKNYYRERAYKYKPIFEKYREKNKERIKENQRVYKEKYKQETEGYCKTCNRNYVDIDTHFARSIHKKKVIR